jgi:hypothetical protein
MTDGGLLARLSTFLGSEPMTGTAALVRGRVIAVGWATVELDRAVEQVGTALRLPAERFVEADASIILGARCLVATGCLPAGVAIVLVEPNTEGRLAASLARHDEGPIAGWLAVEPSDGPTRTRREDETRLSLPQPGPFGPERLILDGAIHGPHRLLIERPGTIPT